MMCELVPPMLIPCNLFARWRISTQVLWNIWRFGTQQSMHYWWHSTNTDSYVSIQWSTSSPVWEGYSWSGAFHWPQKYLIQRVCNFASSSMLVLLSVLVIICRSQQSTSMSHLHTPYLLRYNHQSLLWIQLLSYSIYLHRAIIDCLICCSQCVCHFHYH